MPMTDTVRILAQYALAKKGTQLEYGTDFTDDVTHPSVKLPGISWGNFFEVSSDFDFVDDDDVDEEDFDDEVAPRFLNLPVLQERLQEYRKVYPAIRESEWMERDGHVQMTVPLDLPIEFLKSLIDESYELIWQKLDDHQMFLIERATQPIDNHELLDELIECFQLQSLRKAIHGIARRAIFFRTKASAESKIPVGVTKFGGSPDLPPSVAWPA